MRSLKE